MKRFEVRLLLFVLAFAIVSIPTSSAQSTTNTHPPANRRPIIYVMPNAESNPGGGDNSQVVDSSHNGKEPQVAKIYQELQHRQECQAFSENMMKEKADYFLLLQHGGGKGNRWAVSDKDGTVIASGDSLVLGNSVKDACVAMTRNWQQHAVAAGN